MSGPEQFKSVLFQGELYKAVTVSAKATWALKGDGRSVGWNGMRDLATREDLSCALKDG